MQFEQDVSSWQGVAMDVPSSPAPLIVTATLPGDIQAWADHLRTTHFPPERNFLKAHVTLFHALPPMLLEEVRSLMATLAGDTSPIDARIDAVMDLGGGTALRILSPQMFDLRAQIADHFHGMLSAQDQSKPRLHITVQNKVVRAQARALQDELAAGFAPRDFSFTGLALHHYRGGPWEAAGQWSFRRRYRS